MPTMEKITILLALFLSTNSVYVHGAKLQDGTGSCPQGLCPKDKTDSDSNFLLQSKVQISNTDADFYTADGTTSFTDGATHATEDLVKGRNNEMEEKEDDDKEHEACDSGHAFSWRGWTASGTKHGLYGVSCPAGFAPDPSPTLGTSSSGCCKANCYSEQACKVKATSMGLGTSGAGAYEFAGDFSNTGCYYYSSGYTGPAIYKEQAFYGKADDGGEVTEASQLTTISSPNVHRLDTCEDSGSGSGSGSEAAPTDAPEACSSGVSWKTGHIAYYSNCVYSPGTCCPSGYSPESLSGITGCCQACATGKSFKLYNGKWDYPNAQEHGLHDCPSGYARVDSFSWKTGFSQGCCEAR